MITEKLNAEDIVKLKKYFENVKKYDCNKKCNECKHSLDGSECTSDSNISNYEKVSANEENIIELISNATPSCSEQIIFDGEGSLKNFLEESGVDVEEMFKKLESDFNEE